jgi:hypothetical protein
MASQTMNIQIDDLVRACELLLEHVRTLSGETATLDSDYYWIVSDAERYDPTRQPTTIDLGQLSCDLDLLADVPRGDLPPVGRTLIPLASLLRAVGEKYPS